MGSVEEKEMTERRVLAYSPSHFVHSRIQHGERRRGWSGRCVTGSTIGSLRSVGVVVHIDM